MQKDFWNNRVSTKEITVNVYHDEREIHNKWLYHSFLFIPVSNEKHILKSINDKRGDWNRPMHFVKLRGTRTDIKIVSSWIDYFCIEAYEQIYFYLLGVNYKHLEKNLWNKKTRDHRIYNRFFQIGLYGAIKWFFLYSASPLRKIIIKQIFSDLKSREEIDSFLTESISAVSLKAFMRDESICFVNDKIVEVESDHRKELFYPSASHLIQFVDIIMGTFSQIFDNTSTQLGKVKCAEWMLKYELPKKIMKINTHSRYYKRYAISFFPKGKVTKEDIEQKNLLYFTNAQFYNRREMKYTTRDQMSLF